LLHREPLLAKERDEIARRFDLLKPELTVAEDRVDDDLCELLLRLDVGGHGGLHGVEPRCVRGSDSLRAHDGPRRGREGTQRDDYDEVRAMSFQRSRIPSGTPGSAV